MTGSQKEPEHAAPFLAEMTGAELAVTEMPPAGAPSIFVGAAAIEAGLRLDDIDSPSREGLRVVCDGRRVLLAGQNDTATIKAACRLLEHWGCRYYLDHPLGEVFPASPTLSLATLDLQDKPGFVYRHIWGSQWSGDTLWKIWNGHGIPLNTEHAWGNYADLRAAYLPQHPPGLRSPGRCGRDHGRVFCRAVRLRLRGLTQRREDAKKLARELRAGE